MEETLVVLCDTNIFIEVYKQNSVVKQEVSDIKQTNICTSVVCAAELCFGAINKKELLAIKKDLSAIQILQIESPISTLALQLMEQFVLSNKVGYADFLIAATVLHHNLQLYTLNKKDFRFIPGIKFYK